MRLFKKQLVVLTLNVLVFLVLASTISNYTTSYVEGGAFTTSSTTTYSTGSRYFITAVIPSGISTPGNYALPRFTNNSTSNFSPTAVSYTNLSDLSFENSWFIRGTSNNDLEIYYFNSVGDKVVLTVQSTLTTQSIRAIKDASSTWKLEVFSGQITLGNNQALTTRRLGLFAAASGTSPSWRNYLSTTTTSNEIIKLDLYEVSAVSDLEKATDFADEFLYLTNNKAGNCQSTETLNWSSLETKFNNLPIEAKNQFTTVTTNGSSVLNARNRYNYLLQINNSLNDFVNAA